MQTVLTLAPGIGANTAIFSVINAVMLRPLRVERPEDLIALAAVHAENVEPVFSYSAYIDTGFDPDQVLLFRVTPPTGEQPVSVEERRNLYRQLLARAEGVPGVDGASASFAGVFTRGTWGNAITVEGFVPRAGVTLRTFANSITPCYFDVMRIAVLRGRGFTDRDHETAPKVAVVNETFARRFFGDADPIGKRVGLCSRIRAARRRGG